MQSTIPTLLFGMPSGSEWILIIIALAMIFAPIVLVFYLIKKYLNNKKSKQVINKL